MKDLLVYKKYTFHRFNTTTNTIEDDFSITVTRPMKPAESIRYHRLYHSYILFIVLTVLLWVAAFVLTGCALCCILPDWCAGIGIAFIGLTYIPFIFILESKNDTKQLLMKELSQTGFENADIAYKFVENEVKKCAEMWREAHYERKEVTTMTQEQVKRILDLYYQDDNVMILHRSGVYVAFDDDGRTASYKDVNRINTEAAIEEGEARAYMTLKNISLSDI